MKQIGSAIIAFLLLSAAAQAQQPNWGPQPLSPSGDASSTTSLSTGSTTTRSLGARGADVVNVKDSGAICDGVTHPLSGFFGSLAAAQAVYPAATSLTNELDGVAIQKAVSLLVARSYAGSPSAGRLVFPGGACRTNISISFQALNSLSVLVDGAGTILWGAIPSANFVGSGSGGSLSVSSINSGQIVSGPLYGPGVTQGTTISGGSGGTGSYTISPSQTIASGTPLFIGPPVINALGMHQVTIRDLAVYGDATTPPAIGIAIGRLTNPSVADSNALDGVHLYGRFSFADMYNFASEVTNFHHVYFSNDYSGSSCYTFVQDGQNHWGLSPAFTTDSAQSFNENSVDGSSWITATNGCTPSWIAGTFRHTWSSSYIANFTGSGYGTVLWDGGSGNTQLTMDVHFETSPTDIFYLDGPAASVSLVGFRYRDHLNQATNSIFKASATVTSASMSGGSIEVAAFLTTPHIFDNASLWSGNPDIYLPSAAAWNWSANFAGVLREGGNTFFDGTLTNASLPSPLQASLLQSVGSVTAINVSASGTSRGNYINTNAPVVSIAAPPAGGSTATAHVDYVDMFAATPTIVAGGSGYTNGTVTLTLNYAGCVSQPTFQATVSAGVVTAITGGGVLGKCTPTIMTQASVPTTGGGGTGATLNMTTAGFGVFSVFVDGGGAGYTTTPAVTFNAGSGGCSPNNCAAQGTAALSNSMTLQSASGQVLMNVTGTTLGTYGTSGAPTLSAGALIDNSGVRQSLGSTYTVPTNTSLVRFIQSSTVAASTVTLPTALADGQPIQFVNYAGAITALTFSPAVNGWTNATTLTANTGLRIRWDATSAAWFKE